MDTPSLDWLQTKCFPADCSSPSSLPPLCPPARGPFLGGFLVMGSSSRLSPPGSLPAPYLGAAQTPSGPFSQGRTEGDPEGTILYPHSGTWAEL